MRRSILLLAVAAVGLLLASGVALAVTSVVSGGAINQVKVARSDEAFNTTSASYVDIPGATVQVTAPRGGQALLLARFSAESICTGGAWCSVRIVAVKGGVEQEMEPASGTDFAFDSPNDNWESNSMDRSLLVGRGTYTVKAQAAVIGGSSFRLDDWSLTVERARA
jgi:hypothetical protein